jgi:hypothetical protein
MEASMTTLNTRPVDQRLANHAFLKGIDAEQLAIVSEYATEMEFDTKCGLRLYFFAG